MGNKKFSNWVNINEIEKLSNLDNPGIYAVAYSSKDILSKKPFDYIYSKNFPSKYNMKYVDIGVIYYGMTKDRVLRKRLKEFKDTINNISIQHGGAVRFCFNLNKKNVTGWQKKLYISVMPFISHVSNFIEPDSIPVEKREELSNHNKQKWISNLELKGDIVRQEYICFAKHVKKCKILPQFNDMKRSQKK